MQSIISLLKLTSIKLIKTHTLIKLIWKILMIIDKIFLYARGILVSMMKILFLCFLFDDHKEKRHVPLLSILK